MFNRKEDILNDSFQGFKVHNSIIKKKQTAIRNFDSIPKNATIKLEWVKCGRKNCCKCSENEDYHIRYGYHHPHGPYFYAYFRDKNNSGKLKKKYIGDCDVKFIEEFKSMAKNSFD